MAYGSVNGRFYIFVIPNHLLVFDNYKLSEVPLHNGVLFRPVITNFIF
jgi:hypothetical protein